MRYEISIFQKITNRGGETQEKIKIVPLFNTFDQYQSRFLQCLQYVLFYCWLCAFCDGGGTLPYMIETDFHQPYSQNTRLPHLHVEVISSSPQP